jgi:Zn-dependent protease
MIFLATRYGIEYAMVNAVVLIFSICCHEYMHARAALWQGDDTAKLSGHLTLNPLKQMGVVSLIMMLMVGLAFGQVPVNRAKLRRPYGEAFVSFAGPFANLVLFFIFSIGLAVSTIYDIPPAAQICQIGGVLNSVLFMLNMAPFPPLDGYGIVTSFFPELRNRSSEFMNGATFLIIMILFMSIQYLFLAGGYLTVYVAAWSYQLLMPVLGA